MNICFRLFYFYRPDRLHYNNSKYVNLESIGILQQIEMRRNKNKPNEGSFNTEYCRSCSRKVESTFMDSKVMREYTPTPPLTVFNSPPPPTLTLSI